MKPLRCPTCELQWNIREDAPAIITCPRCLTALHNPYSTSPPPLPSRAPRRVLPVEDQVKRDTLVGHIGIVVVLFIVGFGVLSLVAAGVSGANARAILGIAFLVVVASSVAIVLLAVKAKRTTPPAPQPAMEQPTHGGLAPLYTSNTVGQTLDYNRFQRDDGKLSNAAFFGQAIGGIILGIVGTLFACGAFAGMSNGNAAMFGILVAPAVGIGLCFTPKLRGLGVGLIVALPVAFLLLLGFCAILLVGSSGFHGS